jgi:hypothetical protein
VGFWVRGVGHFGRWVEKSIDEGVNIQIIVGILKLCKFVEAGENIYLVVKCNFVSLLKDPADFRMRPSCTPSCTKY